MIFDLFSSRKKQKEESVPDEILMGAMQLIITALEFQISTAKEMSNAIPDGEKRFDALLNGSFFYGYVVGLNDRIAADKLRGYINEQNFERNISRLTQGVVANLFYPDSEPDWDYVRKWEAQAIAFGASQNTSYDDGVRTGTLLGEEILNESNNFSATLLSAELLKPL